jgi:hypothetical protein
MPTKYETSRGELVLVKEKIPYTGKGINTLLSFLRQVLETNKYTQKLIIEVHKPILIEKWIPKDEATDEPVMGYVEAVRSKPMTEYIVEKDTSPTPYEQLFEMFGTIDREGFEACQVLTGDIKNLQKWSKLPKNQNRLFGVPIAQVNIPEDVVIICGANAREAGPEEIEFSVKGVIA